MAGSDYLMQVQLVTVYFPRSRSA